MPILFNLDEKCDRVQVKLPPMCREFTSGTMRNRKEEIITLHNFKQIGIDICCRAWRLASWQEQIFPSWFQKSNDITQQLAL